MVKAKKILLTLITVHALYTLVGLLVPFLYKSKFIMSGGYLIIFTALSLFSFIFLVFCGFLVYKDKKIGYKLLFLLVIPSFFNLNGLNLIIINLQLPLLFQTLINIVIEASIIILSWSILKNGNNNLESQALVNLPKRGDNKLLRKDIFISVGSFFAVSIALTFVDTVNGLAYLFSGNWMRYNYIFLLFVIIGIINGIVLPIIGKWLSSSKNRRVVYLLFLISPIIFSISVLSLSAIQLFDLRNSLAIIVIFPVGNILAVIYGLIYSTILYRRNNTILESTEQKEPLGASNPEL